MVQDPRIQLISFTGSTNIGKGISADVHKRFGRTILELGGNNAAIIMDDADLAMALEACVFACVGTAGQRCTTLRRILLHESIYDKFVAAMVNAYKTITIGDPLHPDTLMGPLHTKNAVKEFVEGIEDIKKAGGKVLYGGNALPNISQGGNYVEPTLIAINHDADIVKTEIFVPLCHIIKFKTIDEAIAWNNEVPQGLSSTIFTKNLQNYF